MSEAPTREEVIQCLENFTQLLRDVPEIEPTYVRRMSSSDGTVVIEVEAKGPGIEDVPEEALS